MTAEEDSISRNAESPWVEQLSPSSASSRPAGHLHTATGPGANTHMWEQAFCWQSSSGPVWSTG